ncbi:MAG: serine hydrolase domain-containing protein [Elainellaceae cyanobacterium]
MKQALAIVTFTIILLGLGCRESRVIQTLNSPTVSPSGQETAESPKATPLFSKEVASRLNWLLRDEVNDEELPGVALYVSTSNGTWMGAAGKANQEANLPLKPTDRFRIGNLTTMFVAVACLQLVEEGLLDLDQPITSYLPQDISDRLASSDRITVRRLLNHTSGLADVYTDEFLAAVQAEPERQWTAEEVLEYAYDLEPATVRGAFSYANTNYLLLQLVIETVTEQPLAKVIRDRILNPIGLGNTFMEVREPIPEGFIQGYQDWNQDDSLENVTQPLINSGLGLGDKGLVSNAPDLVQFFQALFIDNELLYRSTLDEMLDPTPAGKGDGFGLGIAHLVTRWGEGWGQIGKTTGFQAVILYFPVHDLTLVVWANQGDRKHAEVLDIAEDSLNVILGEANYRY